jgi:hypothetical protein
MADVIVFAGPSLPLFPENQWEQLLKKVQFQPPAQQGDVLLAMDKNPKTILLLDGYYFDGRDYSVPSVTHKELLNVLDAGVRVIGAASMGALYAAELTQYGMIGIGQVFEWFRDGILQGNDEVIVLHLPEEFGYKLVTVALVEVRYALQNIARNGYLSLYDSELLVQEIKKLSFTERSLHVILQLAHGILGKELHDELRHALLSNSIKRADAKLALQACTS